MINKLPLVHKTIFAIRKENQESDFLLVLADPRIKNQDGQGRIIEQSNCRLYYPEIVFDANETVTIKRENILETIQVQCRQQNGRYIIPKQQYKRISYEIANDSQSSQSQQSRIEKTNSQESSSQEEEFEPEPQFNTLGVIKKRGRPKGSKNKKKYGQRQQSEQQQDEFDQEQKRGRGRPKGSKNKKNLLKKQFQDQSKQTFELKALMLGYLKRGKGRPKGSKNKPKRKLQNLSNPTKQDSNFWKRGKGRPKGSKNKIKNLEKQRERQQRLVFKQQLKQKRTRGRPKGVKNKPRSEPSVENGSENNSVGGFEPFPEMQSLEEMYCCQRCETRKWKEKILQCSQNSQIRQILQTNTVYNLAENFQLEKRTNLFINAIKQNNHELLNILIQKNTNKTTYFKCIWETENKIDVQKYQIKTHKQALSRSGKQGIIVLLHDYFRRKNQIWWKQIGLQRILETLHNQTSLQILQVLKNDKQLQKQIYENIPTIIRTGNHNVSKNLLKEITISNQKYQYCHEHHQCLESELQLQYKKMNILKRNTGINYCSPIHCAAINPNSQILENIVKNFPGYNVCDNLGRKPIHYAAACQSSRNLQILLKYGSDLKDLDKSKMTPLMIASYYGRVQIIRYIIQRFNEPLYLNFKSEQGFTALHYAVLNNHLDCVNVLINNHNIDINAQTKEKQTAVHLVCGSGNLQILIQLIQRNAYIDYYDIYKKTPFMYAIRNNNFNIFRYLMQESVKFYKFDSSLNSMLHYSAAYGNYSVIEYLLSGLKQTKNKRKLYPWEMAVGKGHLACAKLLEADNTTEEGSFKFEENILFLMIKSMNGTKQNIEMIKYLIQSDKFNMNSTDTNGFTYLHYCCNINEQDYIKTRIKDIHRFNIRELKDEYRNMQNQIINLLLKQGNNKYIQNKNKENPFTLCIQNGNYIGMMYLMDDKISLDYQTSNGNTILYYLSALSSQGPEECEFTYNILTKQQKSQIKLALKKVDSNGFQPILYFIRDFTQNIKLNFRDNLERIKSNKVKEYGYNYIFKKDQIEGFHRNAFEIFQRHQEAFLKLISFFVDLGSNVNAEVIKQKKDFENQGFQKWGIQHFLMRFPTLKLIKFFRNKIRDFNMINAQGRTPLHLFCIHNKKGNLLQAQGNFPEYNQYYGQKILEYLLEIGMNPNILDHTRSLPLLYAALNKQITFIVLLKKNGSKINTCNSKNQVPFIEIIKMKDSFTFHEIESILKIGADPNFQDLQKRNSLHHLVESSTNFDTSPQVCKILFDHNVKINGLDKYNRTPIFYCFTKINPMQIQSYNQITNDKVQIVQTLINHKDINLNHVDFYHRTAIHYACQKDYFFSILYLLDKNIDINIEDFQGNTPLAVCLKHKNLNQAALLIKKGVTKGFVNEGNHTVSYFSYALNKLSVGICYMLLDHGYPIQTALQEVSNNLAFKKVLIKKYKECK